VTALLGTSLMRVLTVDRGFTADRVLAVDLALPAARYAQEPVRQATYGRVLAAIHTLPAIEYATTASRLPLSGGGTVNFIAPEGSTAPRSKLPTANFRYVAPEFFRTLTIAVTHGRAFKDTERDPNRPTPVLISEPTAARLWPGEDPIGKHFSRGLQNEPGFEVVGLVTDARMNVLDQTPPLMVYVPYWWRSATSVSLLIKTKTAADPLALMPEIRHAVREIDPEIAIGLSRPLEQLVDASVAGRRYQTQLLIAFGAVALFIATVGVYAVTSYGVSRRRREMNIRVALGAESTQVIRLILRQATTPVLIGVAAGTVGALALGGVVANQLFGVQSRDPLIVAIVVAIVTTVGVATCTFAARQGLSLDPAAALRDE
jgi:predicted permease